MRVMQHTLLYDSPVNVVPTVEVQSHLLQIGVEERHTEHSKCSVVRSFGKSFDEGLRTPTCGI